MDALLGAVARCVTKKPRWVLFGLAIVSLAAAALLPRLRIDPEVTAFLPRGDERVELLTQDAIGERAGRRLWIALAREGRDSPGGKRLADRLEAVGADLRELTGVESVALRREALLRIEEDLPSLALLSDEALAALEEQLDPERRRAAVADIRRILAEDPLGGQERVLRDPLGLRWALEGARDRLLPLDLDTRSPYLVTADGELAVLALEGKRPPFDVDFSVALVGAVESVLGAHGFTTGENAYLVGGYAVARSDSRRIKGDLVRSLLWSVPLVMLFLMISSRSFLLPHLYLIPVLIANLWALGFGGALLGPLTPLALSSAAILTGLGVDFAIHYSERWREERVHSGAARAVRITTVETGRGLVAGMLTSGAAFMAFSTSSLPGLVSFGILLTLGLGSALVVTLLLEPVLLERFLARSMPPDNRGHKPRYRREVGPGPVVRAALRYSTGPHGWTAALLLVLASLGGWGLCATRGLAFSADPAALRPENSDLARAAGAIRERLSFSPIPLRVLVPARDGALDRDLVDLERGARALIEGGHAALVIGPQDVLPGPSKRARLARLKLRAATLWEEVAADLATEGLRAEPFRPPIEDLIQRLSEEPPRAAPRFVVSRGGGSSPRSWWLSEVYPRADLGQSDQREDLHTALLSAFGPRALIADPHGIGDVITPILREELSRALAWAAALMVLFVVLSVGGIGAGSMALLPVVLGFGVTLGILVVLGIELTPGNLMAIPLILGLGVDDGVHLVLRRLQAKKRVQKRSEGGGTASSILATTGKAIWRTSATTALGFGSLVTAQTPAIASLGLITLIGVVATLFTSLFVLPAFWSRRDSHARKGA